jgi:hypothetical protein
VVLAVTKEPLVMNVLMMENPIIIIVQDLAPVARMAPLPVGESVLVVGVIVIWVKLLMMWIMMGFARWPLVKVLKLIIMRFILVVNFVCLILMMGNVASPVVIKTIIEDRMEGVFLFPYAGSVLLLKWMNFLVEVHVYYPRVFVWKRGNVLRMRMILIMMAYVLQRIVRKFLLKVRVFHVV